MKDGFRLKDIISKNFAKIIDMGPYQFRTADYSIYKTLAGTEKDYANKEYWAGEDAFFNNNLSLDIYKRDWTKNKFFLTEDQFLSFFTFTEASSEIFKIYNSCFIFRYVCEIVAYDYIFIRSNKKKKFLIIQEEQLRIEVAGLVFYAFLKTMTVNVRGIYILKKGNFISEIIKLFFSYILHDELLLNKNYTDELSIKLTRNMFKQEFHDYFIDLALQISSTVYYEFVRLGFMVEYIDKSKADGEQEVIEELPDKTWKRVPIQLSDDIQDTSWDYINLLYKHFEEGKKFTYAKALTQYRKKNWVYYGIIPQEFYFDYTLVFRECYIKMPIRKKNKGYTYDGNLEIIEPIVYNSQCPKEISKLNLDLSILHKMNVTPQCYSVELFKVIDKVFKLKFNLVSCNNQKLRIKSVAKGFFNYTLLEPNKKTVFLFSIYFMDFRGRIYPKSPYSHIETKLFRSILIPLPNNNISVKKNDYYYDFAKYIYIAEDQISLDHLSAEERVFFIVGLYDLGKSVKSKIKSKDLNGGVYKKDMIWVGLEIFLSDSLKNIIKKYSITDIDDVGSILVTIEKLKNFLINKEPFNVIVDSTASGIFHLNIWLNIKDDWRKYINLEDSSIWWDTYTILLITLKKKLIEIFKEEDDLAIKEKRILEKERRIFPEHLFVFFTRKKIKNLFMTIPYGAKEYKLWEKFTSDLNSYDRNELWPFWRTYVLPTIYYIFDTIYHKKLFDLIDEEKWPIFKDKEFKFWGNTYDMKYYFMTVKRNNVMYRGERRRVTRQILKNPIKRDVTKETTAFIANLIHATDAIFLREIYLYCHRNNIYISTVHDEFILPVNNLFEFIEISSHIYEDMYYEINKKKINVTSSFIFL